MQGYERRTGCNGSTAVYQDCIHLVKTLYHNLVKAARNSPTWSTGTTTSPWWWSLPKSFLLFLRSLQVSSRSSFLVRRGGCTSTSSQLWLLRTFQGENMTAQIKPGALATSSGARWTPLYCKRGPERFSWFFFWWVGGGEGSQGGRKQKG